MTTLLEHFWRVSLTHGTKHSGFKVEAKTAKEAWSKANVKQINRHGHKALLPALFAPKSITKIDPSEKKGVKEEYKGLAKTIHEVLGEAAVSDQPPEIAYSRFDPNTGKMRIVMRNSRRKLLDFGPWRSSSPWGWRPYRNKWTGERGPGG